MLAASKFKYHESMKSKIDQKNPTKSKIASKSTKSKIEKKIHEFDEIQEIPKIPNYPNFHEIQKSLNSGSAKMSRLVYYLTI